MSRPLTKYHYLDGLECPRKLWLTEHRPLEVSEASERRQDQGRAVGDRARAEFKDGKFISSLNRQQALLDTQEAIANGHDVLFEAAFQYDGNFVRIDVLRRETDGSWDTIEVKSATNVNKKQYLKDVAFQYFVASNSGLDIERCFLMHLNRDCKYPDLSDLFLMEEVTDDIGDHVGEVAERHNSFYAILNESAAPDAPLKRCCKKCDYLNECWSELPDHSILTAPKIDWRHRDDMLAKGCVTLDDISGDDRLKPKTERYIQCVSDDSPHIDKEGIRVKLDALEYPLYFFDFETIDPAIPRHEGVWPLQQVPFQYSLHVLYEDGRVKHSGYLHDGNGDPRPALLDNMLADLGRTGSIIVYYAQFERKRLEELQAAFPKHQDHLQELIDRLWDQYEIFEGSTYVHPDSYGSASIKYVLPALVPEFSYDGLDVSDGQEAQVAYEGLRSTSDEKEAEQLYDALWEYCKLDTKAMLEIHRHLVGIV